MLDNGICVRIRVVRPAVEQETSRSRHRTDPVPGHEVAGALRGGHLPQGGRKKSSHGNNRREPSFRLCSSALHFPFVIIRSLGPAGFSVLFVASGAAPTRRGRENSIANRQWNRQNDRQFTDHIFAQTIDKYKI
jgi:hypothetical protein